uniref:Uncharacterized protein n=1 Tax=Raphanus sativus TaxID=3726 RepID=A0A650GA86_RAPSA|nr:hypothetical protein [Raphanus sativus]
MRAATSRRRSGSLSFWRFRSISWIRSRSSPNWRFRARKESELSISLYNDEREGRALRSIGLPFLSVGRPWS